MANRLDIKSLTIKNEHIFEAVNVAREVLGEQVDHLEIKIEGIVRKHIEEVNHRQEAKLKMLEYKVDRMTHLLERNMKTETRTRNLSDPSTRQFHLKPIEFEDLDEPCTGKEVLGSGGFGTVYKGKLNGRTVAVKMLKKDQNAGKVLFYIRTLDI